MTAAVLTGPVSVTGPSAAPVARLSPDRKIVATLAITLVLVIMVASYIFSFAAIVGAAAWSGVPSWGQPLAPIFIDGPILTYTITFAVFRYRGEPARRTLFFLYLFTVISTIVNVGHALAYNNFAWHQPQTWLGALVAASAPLGALLASEEVTRLALVPASPIRARIAAEAAVDATDEPEATADTQTPEIDAQSVLEDAPADEDAPFDPDHDPHPEDDDGSAPAPHEVTFERMLHMEEEMAF